MVNQRNQKLIQSAQLKIARLILTKLGAPELAYCDSLRAMQDSLKTRVPSELTPEEYFLKEFLRKCYFDGNDASCREMALSSFLKGEVHNSLVNTAFEFEEVFYASQFQKSLRRAQKLISSTLGPIHSFFSKTEFVSLLNSGGATAEYTSKYTSRRPWVKEAANPGVSGKLYNFLWKFNGPYPEKLMDMVNVLRNRYPQMYEVDYNVLAFVPKNATTHRTITKEPVGNMLLQRATGAYFKQRLKRKARIDLYDQGINRRLATIGCVRGLVTLDCENASNTISYAMVQALFSRGFARDWFWWLDTLRSVKTKMPDGTFHTLEMFSSMGNGFTFELESLIFWAIACSVTPTERWGDISVYGDDLICNRQDADAICEIFSHYGFKINLAKSFLDGPIRESCGIHTYNGIDITPPYMRGVWTNMRDCYAFLNSFGDYFSFELREECIAQLLECGLNPLFGPTRESTWIFHEDSSRYNTRYNRRYQCLEIKGLVETPLKRIPPISDENAIIYSALTAGQRDTLLYYPAKFVLREQYQLLPHHYGDIR